MNTRDDLPSETADRSTPSLAARIIHYAARHMPPGLAERLEEEWIADLAEQRGAVDRIRFVLGCCWARQVIGLEPHLYGVGLNAAGHGNVAAINSPYPSLLPRRAAVLLVIVFLHIAAALALIYAIKVRALPIPQPPMTWNMYSESRPLMLPLPLPRPQLEHDTVRIPALPPFIPPQSGSADSFQPAVQPTSSPPTPSPAPIRMSGGIGKGFPDTVDYYPASAVRLGESGLTAVGVCVDDHGRLTTEPKIAVSSGSPRLDGGALALARAGSGHYRSTTENGKAISGCFQIGVRFTLKS